MSISYKLTEIEDIVAEDSIFCASVAMLFNKITSSYQVKGMNWLEQRDVIYNSGILR